MSCCWCIPLRPAAILICIITLIWATMEIQSSETFLMNIVNDKKALRYLNLVYTCLCVTLMFAAGILILGILLEKNILVNLFIYYGLFYLCLNTVLIMVGSACTVARNGKMKSRLAVKLIFSIIWNCVYFYFLLVVNSYRSTLW